MAGATRAGLDRSSPEMAQLQPVDSAFSVAFHCFFFWGGGIGKGSGNF